MRPFRELHVWRHAHELTLAVYHRSGGFPDSERFGLQSQMRRAAASVPANIAEGSALSDAAFRRHLRIALGSATELEYHLTLSRDLGYLAADAYTDLDDRLASVKRMLQSFIQRLGGTQQPTAKSQQPTAKSQQPAARSQQP